MDMNRDTKRKDQHGHKVGGGQDSNTDLAACPGLVRKRAGPDERVVVGEIGF
jgi:hypothetical protein